MSNKNNKITGYGNLDSLGDNIKNQASSVDDNNNNNNSIKIDTKSESDSVVVHIRISRGELERLKIHLKELGYDAYSTGIKSIIRGYMKSKNI